MANAGVAAAVIAQAIKASGAIVSLEPNDFFTVVSRVEKPAVVLATSGFRKKTYLYLTGYKGLIFYTKTKVPLQLPSSAEVIVARKIWIPS
ncbi:MAG: hypothetical protein OEY25_08505 [Candidatus Aminicenantes bacterium]|nr:hypothetical protein [Candidatus Aminicenantes bacterium]MDH5467445.1 hypothetical protein [Candidatus Aminicenantes bacterium]MDH5705494.1 hypothetical protein [Candidatus Aminicenantes bacterium]